MNFATILIIVLVLLLIFSAPMTGWHSYGWTPSGVLVVVLIVVVVLVLLGRL